MTGANNVLIEGAFNMHFTEQAALCYHSVRAQYAMEAAFWRLKQGRMAAAERDLTIAAKYQRVVEMGLEVRPLDGSSLPANVIWLHRQD